MTTEQLQVVALAEMVWPAYSDRPPDEAPKAWAACLTAVADCLDRTNPQEARTMTPEQVQAIQNLIDEAYLGGKDQRHGQTKAHHHRLSRAVRDVAAAFGVQVTIAEAGEGIT